ncbi:MAG: hypothetical protein AB1696_23145 [Planctomycetota bacterium]
MAKNAENGKDTSSTKGAARCPAIEIIGALVLVVLPCAIEWARILFELYLWRGPLAALAPVMALILLAGILAAIMRPKKPTSWVLRFLVWFLLAMCVSAIAFLVIGGFLHILMRGPR